MRLPLTRSYINTKQSSLRLIRGGNAFITSLNHGRRAYSSSVESYDVVIVGGGPAGLALACALSK
jgi:NADPH-dependent 2,4-dienoyl-CoA reductase/sulfur reductase-like enzyme